MTVMTRQSIMMMTTMVEGAWLTVGMAGWVDICPAIGGGGDGQQEREMEREKGSKRKAWSWLFVVVVVVEEDLGDKTGVVVGGGQSVGQLVSWGGEGLKWKGGRS